jgi:hypothetical protein
VGEFVHSLHFTLDHARWTLQSIIPLVNELVSLKRDLDDRGYDIYRHQYFGGSGPNGERFFPEELVRIVEIARDIEHRGILIKGFEDGLIDFPHIRSNGEEVYLCWKLGEKDIFFWHRIPDGFAGRRPISEL